MKNSLEKRVCVLGISAYYHDSAATLVIDGKIVASAHEERFTRKKHDDRFPENAIRFVLDEFGLIISDLDAVVFYDKPYLKFERLLETYHTFAPRGIKSFVTSMPLWIKEKIFMKKELKESFKKIDGIGLTKSVKLLFSEHHLSHASSAFFPSSFEDAAILTVDGVGEWATTTISKGENNKIEIVSEINFPNSLGLLYSAFTYYTGFKVNSGEYKRMGLAPYGFKDSSQVRVLKKKILENLISLKEDGSIALNMEYFDFATGLKMCVDQKWEELFGFPPRSAESEITDTYMNLALAIQEITEESMVRLAKTTKKLTGKSNLVMAGGVALNCVANSKILKEKIFDNVWVQPASGDAGGALGAALAGYYIYLNNERKIDKEFDMMFGSYLGPEFSEIDIQKMINKYNANFSHYQSFDNVAEETASFLADGNVVGWFQGKMEWGPRALGNRSILADPRNKDMQKKLNLKIKYREGFRPFAPSVLEEDAKEYFEIYGPSPYMLFTFPVIEKRRLPIKSNGNLLERLYSSRSDIPSITHLDYSARVQTVSKKTNEKYWNLIEAFKKITGYGLLINTSFNVRNEPIVCTPEEAYRCFMNTEMDYLVIGNFIFDKKKQPNFPKGFFDLVFNEAD